MTIFQVNLGFKVKPNSGLKLWFEIYG